MQKICKICNTTKEISCFVKNKNGLYGVSTRCKDCFSAYNKQRYLTNKEQIKGKSLEYYKLNKEKVKLYKQKNVDKIKEYNKEYLQNNKDLFRIHIANRRAIKLNATPKWLNKDHKLQMRKLYKLAKDNEIVSNQKWEVDHIVPLQGSNVCGLHVPWNLQVITAKQNRVKKNKFF